ncbi:hypothetical protein ACFLS9_05620 [Bacteroidota bacterium]
MWNILYSEIKYNKVVILIGLTFVIILNIVLVLSGDWIKAQNDFPGLRVVWVVPTAVVYFTIHLIHNKDKRRRMLCVLPESNFKIGTARLIIAVIFWILLLIILEIFNVIMNGYYYSLSDKVALTSIILILNALPLLYMDIMVILKSKKIKVFTGIIWIIGCMAYTIYSLLTTGYFESITPPFINSISVIFKDLYLSALGTLLLFGIGLILSFSSLRTFVFRKTYLE